jgi:hypothetical protein
MRIAITAAVVLITSMSVSSYAGKSSYNAQAAYGACQVDALQGLHYLEIVPIGKRGKHVICNHHTGVFVQVLANQT